MEDRSDRGVMLLIHGLWFHPGVWTPWLEELDEAGYDVVALPWSGDDQPAAAFKALLRAARKHIEGFASPPIVIGHGVGGAIAERLLNDGDAAAAISLAPVPGGYPAVPAAAHLLRRAPRLALLSLRGGSVSPTFPQFRRPMAGVSNGENARDLYAKHVTAARPREVLRQAVRHHAPAKSRQPGRRPLLLVAGGKDELMGEMSIALLYLSYRRGQPDAITDYKVFPWMDHMLGLGTQEMVVLFYCLDWLTAQNM